MASVALADIVVTLIDSLGPSWGWIGLVSWVVWQLYCPLPNYETKLQQWHNHFVGRLETHETVDIALAEGDVSAAKVREQYGRQRLASSELKEDD